jgi:hypothetical protein
MKFLLPVLALFITSSLVVLAEDPAVVIDFGGEAHYIRSNSSIANTNRDTVNATGDVDFDGSDDAAVYASFGTEWTPPLSAAWTTPDGKNGPGLKFGWAVANLSSTQAPEAMEVWRYDMLRNIDGAESIQQATVPGASMTDSAAFATAYYYEKPDFLNKWPETPAIAFNSQSEISVGMRVVRGSNKGEGRILLRNGDQWYVSEDVPNYNEGVLTINPFTSMFLPFDPNGKHLLFVNPNIFEGRVEGRNLKNITAIGVQMQHVGYDGTGIYTPYQFLYSLKVTIP